MTSSPRPLATIDRFSGGRRLMIGATIAGTLGLIATAIGAMSAPKASLYSYLTGFTYWLGISLGALALLMIFHTAHAKWMVVMRRIIEAMSPMVPFAVLFIPIFLGFPHLFARERHGNGEHYFEPKFFIARALIYFGAWILLRAALSRWSTRQDEAGGLELVVKQRKLSAGGLPLLGFTLTFAGMDWIMGLRANWASTIFGLYYFAGSFVAAIALLIIVVTICDRVGLLSGLVTPSHYYGLGRFLLAFTCFWAYIAFSQYLLIWIANLPEEVPWYLIRGENGWRSIGIFLIVGHFLLPFAVLLSKSLKFKPIPLSAVAAWILIVHYVDLYWVIMPAFAPASAVPRWTDFAALVGVGGFAFAWAAWWLRGKYPVPIRDPYLEQSLRYHKS